MSIVGYNPSDPTQAAFLSALGLGEDASGAPLLGTGGTDLTGSATDEYGFPIWGGSSGSHAAGLYQFQPGTWDPLAAQYGLNFQNPADQNAGAWYEAQQAYTSKTGGDLTSDLQAGKYSSVQTALASIWPSVTGNGANPAGLASALSSGVSQPAASYAPGSANANWLTNPVGAIGGVAQAVGTSLFGGTFAQLGLLIVGGLIILVALWQLLSSTGAVPSPTDTAKVVAKVAAE